MGSVYLLSAAGVAAILVSLLIAVQSEPPWFQQLLYKKSRLPSGQKRSGAVDLDGVDPAAITNSASMFNAPGASLIKRAIDIAASLSLLIFLAPVLAVTAAAIKLESPGPVLYRQTRVGKGGRLFKVFKFRSMVVDAEKNGAQFAAKNDSRVTRVGRIIRRLRIDEIPQVWNVLAGEMSFVGPRPERPEFVQLLQDEIQHYDCRHLVKPGITGWAQVKYEYAATVEGSREKLRYDLFYIGNFSPLLDIAIILMTVKVALWGVGSR